MDKKYKVIEPKMVDSIFNQNVKGNPSYLIFIDGEFELDISCKENLKFKVGDIVDFEQLEKWIDEGLQPIYFTEEVSKHNENVELLDRKLTQLSIDYTKLESGVSHKEWIAKKKELEEELEDYQDKIDSIERRLTNFVDAIEYGMSADIIKENLKDLIDSID